MLRKTPSLLSVVGMGAACLLAAIFLLNRILAKTVPIVPHMSVSGANAENIFIDRLRSAIGSFPDPSPNEDRQWVTVNYLPYSVAVSDVKVRGIDLRLRVRADMRGWSDPPYDGYAIEFAGHSLAGASPEASYKGAQVLITRKPKVSMESKNVNWSNNSLGSLFDENKNGALDLSKIPESCARAFKPIPGERTTDVWATGQPAYEDDRFQGAVWVGSYVVWRTEVEAKVGDLTKTPATN